MGRRPRGDHDRPRAKGAAKAKNPDDNGASGGPALIAAAVVAIAVAALLGLGLNGAAVDTPAAAAPPAAGVQAPAAAAAAAEQEQEQEQLAGLSMTKLRQRARAAGTSEDDLESALDSDDPKAALVELLQRRGAAAQPGPPAAGGGPRTGKRWPNKGKKHGKVAKRRLTPGEADVAKKFVDALQPQHVVMPAATMLSTGQLTAEIVASSPELFPMVLKKYIFELGVRETLPFRALLLPFCQRLTPFLAVLLERRPARRVRRAGQRHARRRRQP